METIIVHSSYQEVIDRSIEDLKRYFAGTLPGFEDPKKSPSEISEAIIQIAYDQADMMPLNAIALLEAAGKSYTHEYVSLNGQSDTSLSFVVHAVLARWIKYELKKAVKDLQG